MTDDTDSTTDDEDAQSRGLIAWLIATLAALLARARAAVAQSIDEIAPQVRGTLGRLRVPTRALKPLALATVLIVAAIALPAAPIGDTGGPETATTEEPVRGETFDAPTDGSDLRTVAQTGVEELSADDAPAPPSRVRASAGTQTMSVTTESVDGDPAIVLEDDRTHEGRWVAIDTAWFQEHLGEVPQSARIAHETNGTYSTPVEVRGDEAAFYVESFSTNTVTFDGVLSVSAGPAVDGDTISYDAPNGGDDLAIDLTGVENTARTNVSKQTDTGSTSPVTIGGNQPPRNETLTIREVGSPPDTYDYDHVSSINQDIGDQYVYEIELTVYGGYDGGAGGDVTVSIGGTSKTKYVDAPGGGTTTATFVMETTTNGNNIEVTSGQQYHDFTKMVVRDSDPVSGTVDVQVDVNGQTQTVQHDVGTTTAVGVDAVAGDNSVTISQSDADQVSWSLAADQVTTTVDPVVEYNGNSVSYNGTLSDGETTSLTVNDSWIEEGQNDISVSLPSVSDGPEPQVGVDVTHDIRESRTINYSAEAFSERYTTSKTWTENTSNATLSIPWASSSVVAVRDVSVTYEDSTGSEPTTRPTPTHRLENGSVVVDLGDVESGWTTEVSATGSKVQVDGADLEVVNATAAGEDLDTRIRLINPDEDVYVRVGATDQGQQLHYLSNASWSNEEASRISADGTNEVRIPNAPDNGEARLRTLPLAFDVENGAIDVDIPDGRLNEEEPVYRVAAGESTGDAYHVTFVDATDDQPYILWSETREIVLDSGTASSPLTLSAEDSDETQVIQFREDDGPASSDGGTGPIGGAAPMVTNASPFSGLSGLIPGPTVLLLGLVGLVGIGVVARETRLFDEGTASDAVADSATSVGSRIGQFVERALSNELVLAGVTLAGGVWLLTSGAFTETERLIISLGSVPVAMFLVLQQFDQFDVRVWAGSTAVVAVLGIQTLAPETFETIAEEAGIVIVLGAVVLGWQALSAWRAEASTPDTVNRLEISTDADDESGGGDGS